MAEGCRSGLLRWRRARESPARALPLRLFWGQEERRCGERLLAQCVCSVADLASGVCQVLAQAFPLSDEGDQSSSCVLFPWWPDCVYSHIKERTGACGVKD